MTVSLAPAQIEVHAKNLTITGTAPLTSLIDTNTLYFDCTDSDNVILDNLTFTGASNARSKLRDTILIDATNGRGPKGFWIHRCRFEAYFDLNITSNADDPKAGTTLPPLLITISNCYFHNEHPDGSHHENNGAVGIHGATGKTGLRNTKINAYATVCNNYFKTVRRRSPRSSGLCYVHAFNNVLEKWGSSTSDFQVNGMESGHEGRLVAQANYFIAGPVRETISVSDTPGIPGYLTIDDTDATLKNLYNDKAVKTPQTGPPILITKAYTGLHLTPPTVTPMTVPRSQEIIADAGPK